jgi:glutamine amidotransferase
MIVVIDYGLGNIHSVLGAIEKLGFVAKASSDIDEMKKADKLILPGVGAFADGMNNLKKLRLIEPLTKLVIEGKKPILGICLGCQIMCRESEEFGKHAGLSWVDASVKRLQPADQSLRVPHVGWDELKQVKPSKLFTGIPPDALFYYTHSYAPVCIDRSLAIGQCDYGGAFDAVFQRGAIYGTQFHPEKSQAHGLRLLRNFLEQC